MEAKPWLAVGHARTCIARKRSRNAWADISAVLNNDGTGCIKTLEQWCKYWKDKKGAVKRKANKIATQRNTTGIEELNELSEAEQKMIVIMGGENAVLENYHQTDPFREDQISDDDALADEEEDDVKPPNKLQNEVIVDVVMPSTSEKPTQIHNFRQRKGQTVSGQRRGRYESRQFVSSPKESYSNSDSETSFARHVKHESLSDRRRRVLQQPTRNYPPQRRSPSSRRSELANLTERFLAIEERRVEAELITAQSRRDYAQGQQTMAQAIDRLAGAINIYASSVNNLLEHVIKK